MDAMNKEAARLREMAVQLGAMVENNSGREDGSDSALHGLERLAAAFALLLDIYAMPNEGNPAGMCDDPAAFRKYFTQLIDELPVVRIPGGVS